MKNSILFIVALVCPLSLVSPILAHEAHEHGVARINLSVEGQKAGIELETPLANLISFEHMPETDTQKEEIRSMAKVMRDAERLFLFPVEANCRLEKISLASKAINDDLLSSDAPSLAAGANDGNKKTDSHGEAKKGEENHVDLDAEITFICRRPEKLNRVEVGMFKAFPNLNKIEVRLVTSRGQKAAELTPKSNVIAW